MFKQPQKQGSMQHDCPWDAGCVHNDIDGGHAHVSDSVNVIFVMALVVLVVPVPFVQPDIKGDAVASRH